MKSIKLFSVPLFLALMMFGTSFSSAYADRGWEKQRAINTMEQAFDYLLSAKARIQNGEHRWGVRSDMRRAYYKIKQAKWSLESSRGSYQSIEALEVAIEKLQDRYLSPNEKLAFAIDCLMVAFTDTLNSARRVGFAAMKVISLAQKINELCLFDVLDKLLRSSSDILYAVHNPQVAEAIEVTLEKINDRYLSPEEKYEFAKECLAVAERALYQRGNGRRF